MLRPLLGGSGLRDVSRVEGGLVNTTYRVTTGEDDAGYAVRVYASGRAAFEAERRLLSALSAMLPVPQLVLADAGGQSRAHPFAVYRWISGITLNECRRRVPAGEFLALAEPLGRLAARIAGIRPDEDAGVGPLPALQVAVELDRVDRRLRSGLARERLGARLAEELREQMADAKPLLLGLEPARGLLHGDFGGRNVLVRAGDAGQWEISGVLDWETAAQGSALWDVGSLFRYSARYAPEFRERFACGHRAAGGALPAAWCRAAKLLDATRLVDTLNEARELPRVFAECRDLVASLLTREV
jgi:Ser/Thr protein kinase RdoA (MazF antagonist)